MTEIEFADALEEVRPIASQAEAEAGDNNTKAMSPLRVKQAIQELGQSLTAENIRDYLMTLNTTYRLPKSAIFGGDFALNFQGIKDLDQYSSLNILFPNVQKGDFWICDDGIGGGFTIMKPGDWLMAKENNVVFEDGYDPESWLIIPMAVFTSIEQIVTALEALTTTNRLNKSAIKGGDYSLNYRGAGDLYGATFQATMTNIMKGDMWVMVKGSGTPSDGEPNLLLSGDIVFATQDNPGNFNYYTGYWIKMYITNKTRTESLANKRIIPRVKTIDSDANPTLNTDDYDALSITALAVNITGMTTNLTGTANDFDRLIIRFKDNGTSRDITWNRFGDTAKFISKGATLPTSTTAGKLTTVTLEYDAQTSRWGCIHVATEA